MAQTAIDEQFLVQQGQNRLLTIDRFFALPVRGPEDFDVNRARRGGIDLVYFASMNQTLATAAPQLTLSSHSGLAAEPQKLPWRRVDLLQFGDCSLQSIDS